MTPPPSRSGVTTVTLAIAVGAAVVTFAAVAAYSWLATATAVFGAIALAAGGRRGYAPLRRAGAFALASAPLAAGVAGAPPLAVAVGAWSAIVAWDATAYGRGLHVQVGAAAVRPVQLRRVRTVALVGVLGVVVGGGAFLAGARGQVALGGVAVLAATALVLALAFD